MNLTAPVLVDFAAIAAFLQTMLQPQPGMLLTPYRTIFMFTDTACPPHDPLVRLMQTFSGTRLFSLTPNSRRPITRRHNEENLYVFLFTRADRFAHIDTVRWSLHSSAHRLVVLLDSDAPLAAVERHAAATLGFLQHYLLLRPNGDCLWRRNHLMRFQIDPTDAADVRTLLRRFYRGSATDLVPWNATVFIKYAPPASMLGPVNNPLHIEVIGVDTMMTSVIARQLNASPTIYSDANGDDASYLAWFRRAHTIGFGKALHGRLYHPPTMRTPTLFVIGYDM